MFSSKLSHQFRADACAKPPALSGWSTWFSLPAWFNALPTCLRPPRLRQLIDHGMAMMAMITA